ncbi:MAG: tRNA pseudouridine(38-40) synthase TruA [Planctomycetota bacterium]
MTRFAITIEYDGTDFHGWQVQSARRTVQQVVETALAKTLGAEGTVAVHGSGRTDAGVHAAGQVAHFDAETDLSTDTLVRALNFWLPDDVGVLRAERVCPDFHARYSAKSKLYRYRLLCSPVPRPLRRRFVYREFKDLNLTIMQRCARIVLGIHDFASFTSSGSNAESTVRRIFRSEWEKSGPEFHYHVRGEGFTYNMVRALVGTMMEAGHGRISPAHFRRIILARDRTMAGPTAAPQGLMLMRVNY